MLKEKEIKNLKGSINKPIDNNAKENAMFYERPFNESEECYNIYTLPSCILSNSNLKFC
jgi:hypothetical protein